MDTIGIILRQKREERGFSLNEVAKKTKIHINVLKALEEDRFEGISPVYVRGFLKIYSRFLGLNEKEIIQKYESLRTVQETFDFEKEKDSKGQEKVVLNRQDLRTIFKIAGIFISLLLLSFLFIKAVRFVRSRYTKRDRVGDSVNLRAEKARGAYKKGIIPIDRKDSLKLSIFVKEDSWIKVKLDGRTVFQNILKRGKTETWQAKKRIELSLGNAGATELEINGKIISGLGRRGQVIKSIVITREGLEIRD